MDNDLDSSWLDRSDCETAPAPSTTVATQPPALPITEWLAQASDRQLSYGQYLDWVRQESARLYY